MAFIVRNSVSHAIMAFIVRNSVPHAIMAFIVRNSVPHAIIPRTSVNISISTKLGKIPVGYVPIWPSIDQLGISLFYVFQKHDHYVD